LSGAGTLALAWRWIPRIPAPVAAVGFDLAGVGAWLQHGEGVRRLEANLGRVRPHASRAQLRGLSRRGMVAYMRYYREIFELSGLTDAQIDARVRAEGTDQIEAAIATGKNPVLALGHMGNWDFAGTWASRHVLPVTTVAERLEPPEVFEEFCQMRAAHGMTIIPLDPGQAFRPLLRATLDTKRPKVVPILADRDLGRGGVEVDWFGQPARLGPGPAALALAAGAPLLPVSMHAERLHGARRRAAGTRWGYVLRFHPPVAPAPGLDHDAQVVSMTRRWADALAGAIREHPSDWHMMQKVFVADLDPARDAAVRQTPADAPDRPGGEPDSADAPAADNGTQQDHAPGGGASE
jgi:KDO2-lipid IV(A) lauroyltransferase